jgi:hypothetical protein
MKIEIDFMSITPIDAEVKAEAPEQAAQATKVYHKFGTSPNVKNAGQRRKKVVTWSFLGRVRGESRTQAGQSKPTQCNNAVGGPKVSTF